jgi:hypothetical protein
MRVLKIKLKRDSLKSPRPPKISINLPRPPRPTPTVRTPPDFSRFLVPPIVDVNQMRGQAWAGIPDSFRPRIWRLFLDYEPVNQSLAPNTLAQKRLSYFDCLKRVYDEPQRHLWTPFHVETRTQIGRDLPRAPHPVLRNPIVQGLFERVLFVWAVRHPASGYVQGMNDLLSPFFFVFLVQYHEPVTIASLLGGVSDIDFLSERQARELEADCFWCFSKLMDGLQDLFTKEQPGLYKMLGLLERIAPKCEPALADWIEREGIGYQEFAFRWMNCLLLREFPLSMVLRLWDSYLANPRRIATTHVFVCAALLSMLAPKLMGLPHTEFVVAVQQIAPEQWKPEDIEVILAQAFVYEKMHADVQ